MLNINFNYFIQIKLLEDENIISSSVVYNVELQKLREELFRSRRLETQKRRENLFLQKQLIDAAERIALFTSANLKLF
jgi:hypothetical protein